MWLRRLVYCTLLFSIFLVNPHDLAAEHIVGGEITYECLGPLESDPNRIRYVLTMRVYRDCQGTGTGFDSTEGSQFTADLTIYRGTSTNPIGTLFPEFVTAERDTINLDPGNVCVAVPENVCVEVGVYRDTFLLDLSMEPYYIAYQRCCRNATIANIISPSETGATFSVEISPEAQQACNSTPQFNAAPPFVICAGQDLTFDHSASDAEGDSLVYAICTPFQGGSLSEIAPRTETPPPYEPVVYNEPAFTPDQPLGAMANFRIDSETGLITGLPLQAGQFVLGICVSEYRNGELLSIVQRDLQFNVTNCTDGITADIGGDSTLNGLTYLNSCGATQITFDNQSMDESIIRTVQWDFPDGGLPSSSAEWEPTIAFPDFGSFSGQLIVNPGEVCSDTAEVFIRISPPLRAEFENVDDPCLEGPRSFNNLSDYDPSALESLEWDFGDGTLIADPQPQHTYEQARSYTVRLWINDTLACSDAFTQTIEYFPLPQGLAISGMLSDSCAPQALTFETQGAPLPDEYQYRWDFGDGNTGQGLNPIHTFTSAGIFTPTLEIITGGSCTASATLSDPLQLDLRPSANFTFDPANPTQLDPMVTFTDQSSGADAIEWDFGPLGVYETAVVEIDFPDTGSYEVVLRARSLNTCVDSIQQTVRVRSQVAVYIPNAFSPNNDGVNDIFRPEGSVALLRNYKLSIWSRWGDLLFESEDPSTGWDGEMPNDLDEAPQGVYVYFIQFTNGDGEEVIEKGMVNLLR